MSSWANAKFFYIEQLLDYEARVIMTLEQLRAALAQFRPSIQLGWKDPNIVPESFDFEYVAEGSAAMSLAVEAGLFPMNREVEGEGVLE